MPEITSADRFAAIARANADAIAVRHDNTSLTYRELAGTAGAIAQFLRATGIRPGDVVATLLDRSTLSVAAMLGIWAAGAAYVNVDAGEPDARVATILPVTGARAVLTDRANAGRVPRSLMLDDIGVAPYEPVTGRSANNLAYLVCVSGPDGAPAAVAVAHGSVRDHVTAVCQRIGPVPGAFATTTTFASEVGHTSLFGALLTGGTLDIADEATARDPKAFAAWLRKHPVSVLTCTSSQLDVLVRTGRPGTVLPTDVLVVGGDLLAGRVARTVLAARPNLAVYQQYGYAETTSGVLMHRVTDADLHRDVMPLGRPLAGVEIELFDDTGQPVADGERGHLHITGWAVARGYLDDAALTTTRFVANAGERYHATGDLVRRNENGDIEFIERLDRRLAVGARRVEPAEIEAVLLAQRGIRRAVVTAEPAGPDRPLELVAYLVGLTDPAHLLRRLRKALPETHVPARIHQVHRIPSFRNGKTNFVALRKLAVRAGQPAAVPARTATERLIANIWCAVLKHIDVDVHTTFADLDGDDATSLAVLGELRRHFPSVTIEQLTAHPTVATLAAVIDPDGTSGPSRATEVSPS